MFRFNAAPTRGYEPFVGSRTTHRIVGSGSWAFREDDGEQLLSHVREASALAVWLRTRAGDPDAAIVPFDPLFAEHVSRLFDAPAATSLAYALAAALLRCGRIDLYGVLTPPAYGAQARDGSRTCPVHLRPVPTPSPLLPYAAAVLGPVRGGAWRRGRRRWGRRRGRRRWW